MYLVIISHCFDDIPLGLFVNRREADEFVQTITAEEYGFAADCEATKYWMTDASTPCSVQVVEFKPAPGGHYLRPVSVDCVKSFGE